jgi:general secretion pathway protein D
MTGIPLLANVPIIRRLFANNRKESLESDIVLTLTPHIVRVLDVSEADLRPFKLGRDAGTAPPAPADLPRLDQPRDRDPDAVVTDPAAPAPAFPQPLQPPLKGPLPGQIAPILPPTPPKKGGGS